jgi:hypothetical protein
VQYHELWRAYRKTIAMPLPRSLWIGCVSCCVQLLALSRLGAQPNANLVDARLTEVVRESFRSTHQGYSSDELLIRDDLNEAFIRACQATYPNVSARDLNWVLVSLRKTGKLNVPTTRRAEDEHPNDVAPIAEIAARTIQDRHGISTDRLLCDPEHRAELDRLAQELDPGADAYDVRKALLHLRKARQLRPELVTRVADWGREVRIYPLHGLVADPTIIPAMPGVYLFRDATGYLYIGEAANLRTRLQNHLAGSDRLSLRDYLRSQAKASISVELHTFDPNSRIHDPMVRRAYESELIRSRDPRFNVRP